MVFLYSIAKAKDFTDENCLYHDHPKKSQQYKKKSKHINILRCLKEISFWPCSSSDQQLSKGTSTTVSTGYILRFYFRILTKNIQVVDVGHYCFLSIVIEVLLFALASVLLITKVYCYYY